ncbi:MAG TPA: alpha-hydroxy acid oxidase [Candidatus Eisenbacteria bacterium]|nr:alpha-hydroxy acid oxidase [Candidatus Eisenbacteria bacterium]
MATRKAMKQATAAGARRRSQHEGTKARKKAAAPRGANHAALAALLNVADVEAVARRKMPRASFEYYAGGAEDEETLARNRAGMDRWVLLHRVLVDVSKLDLTTKFLGAPVSMPVALAPTAFHKLAHPEGERATARAAGRAGVLMTASTIASTALEAIAEAATGPLWFQLYVYKDRDLARDLAERAERSGYRALVLTVDTPILGRRERDHRNGFTLPAGVTMANFDAYGADVNRWNIPGGMASRVHDLFDQSLDWAAIAWLRSFSRLPIVLKGIVRPDDARRAIDAGVDAIIVSNHGGRQLDGGEATVLALPDVVEAVAGRLEVYVDGGFRRGSHILKALALGARGVFIGRPYLFGLAAGGEAGVERVLEILRSELSLAMALAGAPRLAEIDRSLVRPA